MDLDTIDIISNEVYREGPPHELYTALRREAPIFRHRGMEEGYPDSFWAVLRQPDVITVSRQFKNYSSARKGSLLMEQRPDLEIARMLIDTDPPEHTRLRLLVQRGFVPAAINSLEQHYKIVTERLVHEAMEQGTIEFVRAVASELPLIAIAEMLGVPVEDRHRVFEWSNRMIGNTDPDYSPGPEDAANAAAELYMYANELAADRKANPRNDLITTLISAEGDDKLSDHEFDLFVLLLAVAGNETTRNAISHGLLAFIENPDQWRRLRADPTLLDSAVEEVLRWSTPVNYFRRTATSDLELHGTKIAKGEAVVMFYVSANRDEAVFADPFRFDVGRAPNNHVTFGGGGPHHCLGATLARLEIRVLFQELLTRVAGLELTGDVTRLRSNFVHGIKQLPVRLVAA